MDKKNFIKALAQEVGIPEPVVKKLSNKIFEAIIDNVRHGGRTEIRRFGVFFSRERKGRLLHSPRNGEMIEVPSKRIPRFKVGKTLCQKANQSNLKKNTPSEE